MNKSKSTRIILIKGSASLLLEGIVCLFHWELFILNSCTHYLQYTAEYSPAPLKNLMTPCKLESSLKPQTCPPHPHPPHPFVCFEQKAQSYIRCPGARSESTITIIYASQWTLNTVICSCYGFISQTIIFSEQIGFVKLISEVQQCAKHLEPTLICLFFAM